mmetsp:Transcript_78157/g.173238  ORF Transcript_78157/g.173238 Transcript_78157/m.173238 type:complete len:206 (-) Transcript_78157:120-737(-)
MPKVRLKVTLGSPSHHSGMAGLCRVAASKGGHCHSFMGIAGAAAAGDAAWSPPSAPATGAAVSSGTSSACAFSAPIPRDAFASKAKEAAPISSSCVVLGDATSGAASGLPSLDSLLPAPFVASLSRRPACRTCSFDCSSSTLAEAASAASASSISLSVCALKQVPGLPSLSWPAPATRPVTSSPATRVAILLTLGAMPPSDMDAV